MKRIIIGAVIAVALLFLSLFAGTLTVYASQSLTRVIYIEKSGYYEIQVDFQFIQPITTIATGTILVDGVLPFNEPTYFTFPKKIAYEHFPFLQDSFGNDRMPYRTQLLVPDTTRLRSINPRVGTLFVYLEQGLREITVKTYDHVAILDIAPVPIRQIPTYDEYLSRLPDRASFTHQNLLITIEAEAMAFKSEMSIVPSAMSGAGVTPQTPGLRHLNVIGVNGFDRAGDFAEWNFYVEYDGFYYLTFKYMQNMNINLSSFRTIYINGEVPFEGFLAVAFPFTTRWQILTLYDYPVFLQRGENSIRLEVTAVPYLEVLDALFASVTALRNLDLALRAIIGRDVDIFRIWNLENYIPDLAEQLSNQADALYRVMSDLSALTGFGTGEYRALQVAVRDLRRFAETPDNLARAGNSLSQIVGSLTDWLIALESQPVILDKFYVHSCSDYVPRAIPGFFARLIHALQNFFMSFANAATIGSIHDADRDVLQVWVRRNRDYVDLMHQMSEDFFTAQTGIPVNVNFIPDNTVLILANAAGNLPELAGGIDAGTPFEYAIRGALRDLSGFPGFNDVIAPMPQGALIPYRFMDGIYALPEEVMFNVLFYRTDILEAMNLSPPDTWDDVLALLPVLNRANTNFFFPYGDFQTFFSQRGVDVYTPDGLSLAFLGEEGFAAFRFWTDLYVKYGLPARMESFYQHFRMGTAPIGVIGITEYIRFELTAPDIAGLWRIALVPGTVQEDGLVNRSQAGGQNGMMMFNTTPEREERAWKYMQWWLSTPVQILYAHNLENFYGPEFRWYPANFDVLAAINWRPETQAIFQEQMRWFNPVPLVPGGSYMTGREIWNAWTRVVIQRENYREQLERAYRDISIEMARKQLEFDFIDTNGNILRTMNLHCFDPADYFRARMHGEEAR